MTHLIVRTAIFFCISSLFGDYSYGAPDSIAPVFAMAKAEPAENGPFGSFASRYRVTVTCPQVSWKIIRRHMEGRFSSKGASWEEVVSDVQVRTLILDFEGASQVPDAKAIRVGGEASVPVGEMIAELVEETPVLLSLDDGPVDAYYRPFFNPKTLVFILARDEGMGSPRLLPRQKELAFTVEPRESVTRFVLPSSGFPLLEDTALIAVKEKSDAADEESYGRGLRKFLQARYRLPGGEVTSLLREFASSESALAELNERFGYVQGVLDVKWTKLGDKAYMNDRHLCFVTGKLHVKLLKEEGAGVNLKDLGKAYAAWLSQEMNPR